VMNSLCAAGRVHVPESTRRRRFWGGQFSIRSLKPPPSENMKVQSIMTAWRRPDDADSVSRPQRSISKNGVWDLIISNQSHPAWRKALRRSSFLRGPSTFSLLQPRR